MPHTVISWQLQHREIKLRPPQHLLCRLNFCCLHTVVVQSSDDYIPPTLKSASSKDTYVTDTGATRTMILCYDVFISYHTDTPGEYFRLVGNQKTAILGCGMEIFRLNAMLIKVYNVLHVHSLCVFTV